MFFIVLNSLITLLICMALGYVCRKNGIINDEINSGFSNLLVKVTLPCLIVVSMQKPFSKELLADSIVVLITSGLIFLAGTLLGLLCTKLFKADKQEVSVWLFSLTLPNIVYMGFPVIGSALGQDALFFVSVANISFNLIAFSMGIKLITIGFDSASANLKSLLTNPAILATLFGLALFIFSIRLPENINNALSMVGNMTTPLSMIIVGSILAKSKFSEAFKDKKMFIVVFVRLIFIPIFAFIVLRVIITNKIMLGVLVFMCAMPAAGITAIFAEKYNGNSTLASRIVFVTTVLCVFTIPLASIMLELF